MVTRDDIIRMAKQASGSEWSIFQDFMPELERFAALVAAAVADEPRVVLERGDVAMERYLKRIERMKTEGWRQCAVGQRTTQFCGQLEAAVAAEREACARVCDDKREEWGWDDDGQLAARDCANAIRARGE